jgi:hypothetical protein
MKLRSRSSVLRWSGIVLCCCLGVGVPAVAAAQSPAAVQAPGDVSAAKANPKVEKLARQILEASRVSPLDLKKAAALLGSRLGPRQQIHEYRSEWKLVPTRSIAEGTGVHGGKKGWKAFWFTPQASLDLTFQDLAPTLLDLPFDLEDVRVHVHEDSLAKQLDRFEYKFAVPAGELVIGVPANLPKDRTSSREREALNEAWEVARGRGTTRTRIIRILVTNEPSREWTNVPTLRQLRARSASAKAAGSP